MISSEEKLANAVGGKSARACDNCARIRARWYCAADDAFLCQSCDSSVHSGNRMARRHERVFLKTTSIRSFYDKSKLMVDISKPSWHQGFTRKARTPRQKKKTILNRSNNALRHFVPEIYVEENSNEEDEKQILYMVPMFDPFSEEVSANAANSNDDGVNNIHLGSEPKDECFNPETSYLHGFLPTEMDLAEFADDVENILGKRVEDESFDMEGLGIFDVDDKEWSGRVKVEDGKNGESAFHNRVDSDLMIDMERETFELNFDYDSPINCEEEAQDREQTIMMNSEKNMFLRLDYEGVLLAWDGKSSPWTTEERPDLNFDECWPDFMGACVTMHVHGDMGMRASVADEGREARVSRYREKRLTRLFSKKIRYEVRKLNAEKRPRTKGRFVKRANPAGAFPLLK